MQCRGDLIDMPRRGCRQQAGPGGVEQSRIVADGLGISRPTQMQMLGSVGIDRQVIRRAPAHTGQGIDEQILDPYPAVEQFALVAGRPEELAIVGVS